MRNTRSIAGVAITTMLFAGLGVAAATSASAADDGPLQPGNVYLLANNKTLATATAADQVTGGTTYTGKPFTTVAVQGACPAGTAQANVYVRLKTAASEDTWDEAAMGGGTEYTVDANGNAYVTQPMSNFGYNMIQNALAGKTGVLPLALVCQDAGGVPTGYFSTDISIAPTATPNWSQVTVPALPATSTTTTLGSLPASVELGTEVDLSATVAPAAATGDIEYFDGTTSLGKSAIGTPLKVSTLAVGDHSITATYLGATGFAGSTSAAATITVTPAAARTTTTTLAVDVVSGAPYQAVTLSATVAATTGTPTGSVEFFDGTTSLGTSPVSAGAATLTKNTFAAGAHSFTAKFTGNAPYTNSDSTASPVAATYVAVGASDEQTVDVVIPAGSITITTPYNLAYTDDQGVAHPANPLHLGTATLDPATSTYSASATFGDATDPAKAIKITDTRAGNLGFTAKVQSGDFSNGAGSTFSGIYAGLTNLRAVQLAGNKLQATDVTVANHTPFTDGLDVAKTFATYPAGKATGTALLDGTFGVASVPTSVQPGTYTATVVFTAN